MHGGCVANATILALHGEVVLLFPRPRNYAIELPSELGAKCSKPHKCDLVTLFDPHGSGSFSRSWLDKGRSKKKTRESIWQEAGGHGSWRSEKD